MKTTFATGLFAVALLAAGAAQAETMSARDTRAIDSGSFTADACAGTRQPNISSVSPSDLATAQFGNCGPYAENHTDRDSQREMRNSYRAERR